MDIWANFIQTGLTVKKKLVPAVCLLFLLLVVVIVTNPLILSIPLVMTGHLSGARYDSNIVEANERAVTTFVEGKGFGIARLRSPKLWNDRRVLVDGVQYDVLSLHLIGLTHEHGDRYFESNYFPPRKVDLGAAETRPLTSEEVEPVAQLRSGVPMVRIAEQDASNRVRVFAPIRSREECLKCHAGEVGSVLGAFEYQLDPPFSSR